MTPPSMVTPPPIQQSSPMETAFPMDGTPQGPLRFETSGRDQSKVHPESRRNAQGEKDGGARKGKRIDAIRAA